MNDNLYRFLILGLLFFPVHSIAADSLVKVEVESDSEGLRISILQSTSAYVEKTSGFELREVGGSWDIVIRVAVAPVKENENLVAAAIATLVVRKSSSGDKWISRFHNEVLLIDNIEKGIRKIMSEILDQ